MRKRKLYGLTKRKHRKESCAHVKEEWVITVHQKECIERLHSSPKKKLNFGKHQSYYMHCNCKNFLNLYFVAISAPILFITSHVSLIIFDEVIKGYLINLFVKNIKINLLQPNDTEQLHFCRSNTLKKKIRDLLLMPLTKLLSC